MTKNLVLLSWLAVFCVGCGGHYIVTAPDQLASTRSDANVVVRLQRNDFFVLDLAVSDAVISFQIEDLPERAAFTDDLGYAATPVAAPSQPGVYSMRIRHSDLNGDVVLAHSRVFVLEAATPLVAVELDALPMGSSRQVAPALAAMRKMASQANLLYLTREDPSEHAGLHDRLVEAGYPDGPILLWQHKRMHLVRGWWRLPKLVVESRLVSELPELHRSFMNLRAGVCGTPLAAQAMSQAGLTPVVVGAEAPQVPGAIRVESWQKLAEQGLDESL